MCNLQTGKWTNWPFLGQNRGQKGVSMIMKLKMIEKVATY